MKYNKDMKCATYNSLIVTLFETINCFPLRRLYMTFRNIEKQLNANGWILVRVCGSHHQYRKVGCPQAVVIPYHGGQDLSIGVVKDLEKKTGLSLRR